MKQKNQLNLKMRKKKSTNYFEQFFNNAKRRAIENQNEYNNAILKDLEEKWGIWIKKNNLENGDINGKEEENLNNYSKFETQIEKDIEKKIVLNPFTYLNRGQYSDAIKRDPNCCFYGHYLN